MNGLSQPRYSFFCLHLATDQLWAKIETQVFSGQMQQSSYLSECMSAALSALPNYWDILRITHSLDLL